MTADKSGMLPRDSAVSHWEITSDWGLEAENLDAMHAAMAAGYDQEAARLHPALGAVLRTRPVKSVALRCLRLAPRLAYAGFMMVLVLALAGGDEFLHRGVPAGWERWLTLSGKGNGGSG